jgi:hypothetical protein
MKNKNSFLALKHIVALCFMSLLIAGCSSTSIDSFRFKDDNGSKAIVNQYTFNGYTNHWQDVYQKQFRYGNMYKINMPDIERSIIQSKRDLAEKLGIPGLQMQEGFFNGLATSTYTTLDNPSVSELQDALGKADNVLLFVDRESEVGKKVADKNKMQPSNLKSHQTKAQDYTTLDAFMLKNGKKTVYVALGKQDQLALFKEIIAGAELVIKDYDFKRGWFGVQTNMQTVGISPGHPLDLVGKGMNEGNSWFVFTGGYEFLAKDKFKNWVKEANLPIVMDMGNASIFGCDDYEGLQVQQMNERDAWLNFARKKNGYYFRNIASSNNRRGGAEGNPDFDGYFVNIGNADTINNGTKPFVIQTGGLLRGTINSMILFNKKGDAFDRAKMWEAIMDRRAVAIAEEGIILGPDLFRKSMQLMLLDRDYIEDYFGDKVNIIAVMNGHQLQVSISNLYAHELKGTFSIKLPEHLSMAGEQSFSLQLPANSTKELTFDINASAKAMNNSSAVAVQYDWDKFSKSTIATFELPPAISMHELLYGAASGFDLPVTIHNFTNDEAVNVKLTIAEKEDPSKVIFTDEQSINLEKGAYTTVTYNVQQKPGSYTVKVDAMGVEATAQLGIGDEKGTPTLTEVDLNNDGINEYVMENSHVRVTLLSIGARVIEYFVKAKNDNVFFKLWPDKPHDTDRPFREWAFYPYGGFEDFLGQASVETHKVYDATVIKREGNYVQVRMVADFYGNEIEKIYTLYGDSPLLEARFALTMINPEMNVLGPQPIMSLGKEHGVEDKYIFPGMNGLEEYVMKPNTMYGRIIDLKEGWNAGYDTKENISFVGAFPVKRPYYMHMWMNLASNPDSRYPYAELQPWLPLFTQTTSYFSYYMWASDGKWENGFKALQDRNLITQQ